MKILDFKDMAKAGIEKMVDAKLGDATFVPKFREALKARDEKEKAWIGANRVTGDGDIIKIRDVIKQPLKVLLTSEKLELSDNKKLKSQVAAVIKQALQRDPTTSKWTIIKDGMDSIANSIADQVVENREMLAEARALAAPSKSASMAKALKDYDTNRDGALDLDEVGKIPGMENIVADKKITREEINAMPQALRAQFEEILKKPHDPNFVKKDNKGQVNEIDFAAIQNLPNNGAKGLQIT